MRFGLTILTVATMLTTAAAADVKSGVAAWSAGRFGEAIRTWRPLAHRGDADAQFNMGQAYRLGRGVPADPGIARSWFQKAAQQGHAEAQADLGLLLYADGNRKAALPMIRRAAERGDERAQYVWGAALFSGDGVARDWPRAYALMTLAAARGVAEARTSLVHMNETIPAADRARGKALARRLTTGAAVDRSAPLASRPAQPTPPGETPTARAAAAASQVASMNPPPRPGMSGGGWRIQLGAYDSPAAARAQWGRLSGRIGPLGGFRPSYEPFGRYTRLRTGPFASRVEADRACTAARAAGQACFTVRR